MEGRASRRESTDFSGEIQLHAHGPLYPGEVLSGQLAELRGDALFAHGGKKVYLCLMLASANHDRGFAGVQASHVRGQGHDNGQRRSRPPLP